MRNHTIAVVGATGKTGIRVADRLKVQGYTVRELSRQSSIPFDWADRSTWAAALAGVQSAYVTYYPDLAIPQAEDDIRAFTEIAKAAGLNHLVLLSGRGEDGAQRAEQVVMQSGLNWNIVRASWFMQNFSESFMLDGLRAGELVLPQPKADEPFIDVDDIADVAVAALTREDLQNQLLEITGPETLSFSQCVDTIAEASGRSIGFQTAPVEAYLAAAKAEGLPDDIAWLMNELFANVLDGRNAWTTQTVEKVLGRPARSFQHYVQATAGTGVWNAA
jgi:uncharacterized protein YbjT (DUF2867 family)